MVAEARTFNTVFKHNMLGQLVGSYWPLMLVAFPQAYHHFKFMLVCTEMSAAVLALAVIIPILVVAILAIVAVLVYRRWKKKRKGYTATDEAVPMNPVQVDSVC